MSDDHPFRDDEQTKALRAHVDRQLAESVSQPEPVPDAAAEQAEYEALLSATDPIAAFNLFVKRNVDPSLHAHFSDSDANEAEFVRRAIRASMVLRVVLAAGGGAVVGYPGGGASGGTMTSAPGGPGGGGYAGGGGGGGDPRYRNGSYGVGGGGGIGSAEDPRPRYH